MTDIPPAHPTIVLHLLEELARHQVVATPGEERPFLQHAMRILARHGYSALLYAAGKTTYRLSTHDYPDSELDPAALTEEAAPLEFDAQDLGWVYEEEPDLAAVPEDAIPLEFDGRTLGWVHVAGEGRAAELVRATFTSLARNTLITSAAAREERRQRDILDSLYRIGEAAAQAESLEEILQTIYEQTSRFLEVEAFVGALYDEHQHEIELALCYDRGQRYPSARRPVQPDKGIIPWMIAKRSPVLVRDTEHETLPVEPMLYGDMLPTRSWLGVIMEAQGRMVGAISLQSYQPNAFDEADQRLLTQIAQQAALAILTHEGRAAYQRRMQELSMLNEMSRELGAKMLELPLVELLELIRNRLTSMLNVENFYVALYDDENDTVSFPLAIEEGERKPWGSRKAGKGLTEHLIERAAPLLIPSHVDDYLRSLGIQSIGRFAMAWLGVPLWLEGRVIGAMVTQDFNEHQSFTKEDERLMTAAASQVAGVIQIARLLNEEQRQRADLEDANARQAELLSVIRQLSTPIVPIFEGVLAVPLVGTLDSTRSAQVMDELLQTIGQRRTDVVLLDITGVPVVDTSIANHLLQTIRAAQLLGARCAVVGIRPEVAQTIIGLGVDLQDVVTLPSLQEGVAYALSQRGYHIAPIAIVAEE